MITHSRSTLRILAVLTGFYVCLVLGGVTSRAQTTWTLRNSPPGGGDLLWGITDGNGGMVAVGGNGKILHSDDGSAWSIVPSGTNVWLVAVTYGNGRYIAVGDNGTVLSSPDGVSWTRILETNTTARLNNIRYAQNRFVAVGEGGAVIVSDTGDKWSVAVSGVTGWLHGLAYGGGYWMATGEGGVVLISKDGLAWTYWKVGIGKNLEAVAFIRSENLSMPPNVTLSTDFIAVGQDGVGLRCIINDSGKLGETLTTKLYTYDTATGTFVRLGSIAVYNRVFVATGDNGTVITATSEYGPWKKIDLGSNQLINASGFGRSSLFLAGGGETIYQSESIFPSRLINVSTRGQVGTGANVMIGGTVIKGEGQKRLLVRAIGPQLSVFGVSGVVPDPVLTVYDSQGRIVAFNTGWGTNSSPNYIAGIMKAAGAFDLPNNSKDSVLLLSLDPGAYTFNVSSASGVGGVGLVEAYDLDLPTDRGARAINISTRGVVGTDERILIAGFVIQGPSSRTLLIRGVGPTLGSSFGVPGALDDPVIKVIQGDGTVIATNDNWSDKTTVFGQDVTADVVRAAAAEVGAFSLPDASKDAATLVTLAPGSYTVQVAGKNNATGVALVEVYDVQPLP